VYVGIALCALLAVGCAKRTPVEQPAPKAGKASEAAPKTPEPLARTPLQPGQEEEPFDPFARPTEGAADLEEYDPWESYNTRVFEFNRKVDKYVLKPVAEVYDKILLDEVELGIRNFFHNVRFMPRLVNNVLQGKFKGAGLEAGRFAVNSTFGLGGFFDFAKEVFGWETPDEDLGQTLAVYGVKPGPYLILPLLPPFTLRDAFGYTGDIFLDPINYLVFPSIELDGAPSLISHTARTATTAAQFGTRTEEIVNERSINLETFQGVEEGTVDLYGAVRNAYLQKRAKMIKE